MALSIWRELRISVFLLFFQVSFEFRVEHRKLLNLCRVFGVGCVRSLSEQLIKFTRRLTEHWAAPLEISIEDYLIN